MNKFEEALMGKPSVKSEMCVIPGCNHRATNNHHVVYRSAGKSITDAHGMHLLSPELSLCGFGNNLKDADGRMTHHGMVHAHLLHFRWVDKTETRFNKPSNFYGSGHWEYLITKEPTKYQTALEMKGWKKL
jgi:hypothetical protein